MAGSGWGRSAASPMWGGGRWRGERGVPGRTSHVGTSHRVMRRRELAFHMKRLGPKKSRASIRSPAQRNQRSVPREERRTWTAPFPRGVRGAEVSKEAPVLDRVVAVVARPGYRVWVRFEDGLEGEADLSHLAGQGAFRRWTDDP